MSILLRYFFLIRLVLVTTELITLIKDNEIKCVLTEDSVYSPFYISDGTHYININRKIPEIQYSLQDNWTESDDTGLFLPVTDERWTDFKFGNTEKLFDNVTSFFVCTNETSSFKFTDSAHACEVNWTAWTAPSKNCTNDTKATDNQPKYDFYWPNDIATSTAPSNNNNDSEDIQEEDNSQNRCEWKNLTIKNNMYLVPYLNSASYNNATLEFHPMWLADSKVALKFVNYTYYYSHMTSTNISSINVDSSSCVSMYISVDKGCYLNITLESNDNILNQIKIEGFNEVNASKEWRRIEVTSNSKEAGTVTFRRGTDNNKKTGFWAIDEIKNCHPNIVIYNATLTGNHFNSTDFLCKLFKSTNVKVGPFHNSSITGKIGKSHNVSCSEILGNSYSFCEEHKICPENGDCYCPWGYKGTSCNETCTNNFWGINCEENCSQGCENCNVTVGCTKCKQKYYGHDCSEKHPVVQKPPVLISIKPDLINIAIDLRYGSGEVRPKYYAIQYKKFGSSGTFKNFGSKRMFSSKTSINLKMNLSTTDAYQVRTILIHHDKKFFQGDIPTLIINKKSLRTTFYKNTSVELIWDQPKENNSNHYEIHYKCRPKFCSEDEQFNPKNTTKTKITIDLNNQYEICFMKLYNGTTTLIDEIDLLPHASNGILEKELPKSVNFTTHAMMLEDCKQFTGPVNYTIEYKCLSNWCQNEAIKTSTYEFYTHRNSIQLDLVDLKPYTSYHISVIAKRTGQPEKRVNYSSQRTPEKEPHPVENLSVYRKNNDTIWLRWKDHYPPTGQVEMYNVTLQNKSVLLYNTTFFNCILWKEYVCGFVNYSENDFSNDLIWVSAKNYDVDKYSTGSNISFPEGNRTGVIENFKIVSSPSPHKIILTWEYPSYTYGEPLKQFLIRVNEKNISKNITDDGMNYNETIAVKFGKQNYISIWAQNEFEGEKISISVHISNPVVNFSLNPFVLLCSTTCILLLPEGRKETNFTITYNNTSKAKSLGSPRICKIVNSTCTFDTHLGNINTGTVFLNFPQDNKTIPIEFSTEKNELKSTVVIITVVAVLIAVLILSLLLVLYFVRIRKKPCPKQINGVVVKFSKLKEKAALLENYQKETISTSVKITDFQTYLLSELEQDSNENVISAQFQEIPKKTDANCNNGQLEANIGKNRYQNVLPYDETRVILLNNTNSDYINANYIDGYKTPKAFIATQAPTDSTVHDFWLMICQEKVQVIIMLTELKEGGRTKSVQYWPDHNSRFRFGEFLINSSSIKITPNYIHRELQVKYENQTHHVHHFQYTTWPDHSIPLSVQDFAMFVKELINEFPQNNPMVVHCNAGCGRTGTFILCDIVIRMAIDEKKVDFVSVLTKMRNQRAGLVSNEKQYIFAHHVVVEYFFGQDFAIAITDNFEEKVAMALSDEYLKLLMQRLDEAKIQHNKMHLKLQSHLTDEEKAKNRFPNILPGSSQIFLPVTAQNSSNYINAIVVDCYRYPKKFIVTQQPLPETIQDFWKLVIEYDIETIISLNQIVKEDPQCPVFWPKDPEHSWPLDNTNTLLTFISKNDNHATYDIVKVKITKKVRNVSKIINIISVKNWKRESLQPPSVNDLILIWREIMTCNGQIVVTCYDGATASGVFVALAYLLEKMNLDHKCDVYTAVKIVQQSRPQFVEHLEQLRVLYQTALEYVKEFSIYGNFS